MINGADHDEDTYPGVDPTVAALLRAQDRAAERQSVERREATAATVGAMSEQTTRFEAGLGKLDTRMASQTRAMLVVTLIGMALIAALGGLDIYLRGFGVELDAREAGSPARPASPAPVSVLDHSEPTP